MGKKVYNKRIGRKNRKVKRRKLPEISVKKIKEKVNKRINTQIKNRIKELQKESSNSSN